MSARQRKVDEAWRQCYLGISAEMAETARMNRLILDSPHNEAIAKHYDEAAKRYYDKATAI